jgi:hypothetical protein
MISRHELPKVTFGIIVLNGEPFTRYCLRSIYPFAHQIIVAEGANKASASMATISGHSTDGTLESLHRFKAEEDPEGKVIIVEHDGLWSEKDEQSRAYARLATGDYLWQVDVDEFYRPDDMRCVLKMLGDDTSITAVSFKQLTFWGGFDYIVDGWYLKHGAEIYHRLFKWGDGYSYAKHRPPTVCSPEGINLRSIKWMDGYTMARQGVYLYHYSLVFPKQVLYKSVYYSRVNWVHDKKDSGEWAEANYIKLKNPYRVHNVYQYPSWLMRYAGEHPPEIEQLRQDISNGRVIEPMRDNRDVEQLLTSKSYRLGAKLLSLTEPIDKRLDINRVLNLINRVREKAKN